MMIQSKKTSIARSRNYSSQQRTSGIMMNMDLTQTSRRLKAPTKFNQQQTIVTSAKKQS